MSLEQFTRTNIDTRERWRSLARQSWPSYRKEARPEEQTPFSGTPAYAKLSEAEKEALYHNFIQFNAETVAMLELVLYEGMKTLKTPGQDPVVLTAVQKLLDEEKLHTKGFLRFLKQECPEFPRKSFMLRRTRWLKHAFLRFARANPVGLTLPAAKIEAYSVYYGKSLKKSYKQNNHWVELNYLHLLDESHHVNFEFDLFMERAQNASVWQKTRLIWGNLYCILLFQITFLLGCSRIIRASLPERSRRERLRLTFKMGHWILYQFEPYHFTREHLKAHFRRRHLFASWLFRFMYR